MTGSLRVVRTLNDQPIQMEVCPPDYQIDSEYVAGFQLLRDNVGVALLAFNETGIVLRDVVASTRKEVAFATPPQEFDLPLAEGVTPVTGFKNTYSKDQFGVVRVWFSTHFESIPTSGAHVFYLPEGFRPDFICPFTAHFSMGEFYNVAVSIHPSGDALVDHGTIGQTGPINLHGYIEFPSAD